VGLPPLASIFWCSRSFSEGISLFGATDCLSGCHGDFTH
jgi:hypothetical protein